MAQTSSSNRRSDLASYAASNVPTASGETPSGTTPLAGAHAHVYRTDSSLGYSNFGLDLSRSQQTWFQPRRPNTLDDYGLPESPIQQVMMDQNSYEQRQQEGRSLMSNLAQHSATFRPSGQPYVDSTTQYDHGTPWPPSAGNNQDLARHFETSRNTDSPSFSHPATYDKQYHRPIFSHRHENKHRSVETDMVGGSREIDQDSLIHMRVEPEANHIETRRDAYVSGTAATVETISPDYLQRQREHAKGFISLLYENGIKYHDLIKDPTSNLDPHFLKGLYEELGLEIDNGTPDGTQTREHASVSSMVNAPEPARSVSRSQQEPGLGSSQSNQMAQNKDLSRSAKPKASSPSTIDRKDYVARLMAAKTNRAGVQTISTNGSPDATTSKLNANNLQSSSQMSHLAAAPTEKKPGSEIALEEKRRTQTELARRRMEALALARSATNYSKGKGDVSQSANSQRRAEQSLAVESSHHSDAIQIHASSQPTDVEQAVKPSHTSSYNMSGATSRIPGLFMTSPQTAGYSAKQPATDAMEHPPASTAESSTFSALESRLRPPDLNLTQHFSTKRRFGEISSEDDVIIEASDDESEADVDEEIPKTQNRATIGAVGETDSLRDGADLRAHEASILAMKKKIAQLEQRRKTRFGASGSATPADSGGEAAQASVAVGTEGIDQFAAGNLQGDDSAIAVTATSQTGTPAAQVASTLASASREGSLDSKSSTLQAPEKHRAWKKRRRVEIESSLPTIEERHMSDSSRLAFLKKQMQDLQEAMEKTENDKKRLVEELELLEVEPEDEELTDVPIEPRVDQVHNDEERSVHVISDASSRSISRGGASDSSRSSMSISSREHGSSGDLQGAEGNMDDGIPVSGLSDSTSNAAKDSDSQFAGSYSNASPEEQEGTEEEAKAFSAGIPRDDEVDNDSEKSSSPSSELIMDDYAGSESGEILVDSEKDSLEPGQLTESDQAQDNFKPSSREALSVERQSEPEAHSGADSEPDSIEYEPPEIEHKANDISESASRQSSEDYEPPDLHSTNDMHDSTANEITGIQPPPSAISQSSNQGRHEPPVAVAEESNAGEPVNVSEDSHQFTISANGRFTPYESPLKTFKNYRFHPTFAQNVAGGYRSTTYSHNIDPNRPLCPYEANGGVCRDPGCDGQHFQSMLDVHDEMILLQLGTSNPGTTDEEKRAWASSLKSLLENLRERKINDTQVVAFEIAKLRRRFVDDPSRVLDL